MDREIIEGLNQFINWTKQFKKSEYLFRGLKSTSYIKKDDTVETSAHRRLSRTYKATEQDPLLEINRELLEKARLLGHGQRDGTDLSDLDLLAELQHYGAATCLLDFTFNTLVALWFACQQESRSKENGAVVVLRSDGPEPLKKVDSKLNRRNIDFFFKPDETERYRLYQWQPKYQNNRIIAQQSIFVFGHGPIKIENACEIKMNCKKEILIALEDLSGITGASLFFDFHGYVWLNAHDKPLIDPTAEQYRRRAIAAEDPERKIKYFTSAIKINEKEINKGEIEIDEKEKDKLTLENAENYRDRGQAYFWRNDFDKAIADHTKSIELNPESPHAYNLRGIALEAKADLRLKDKNKSVAEANRFFKKAICNYKKAIEIDPELAKAYNNLGNVYASQGALELKNGDKEASDKLFNKAIRKYKSALEKNKELPIAHCNLGEALLHIRDWKKARKALGTAKKMGADIAVSFGRDYKSVKEFTERTGFKLPDDLAKMLTEERGININELPEDLAKIAKMLTKLEEKK